MIEKKTTTEIWKLLNRLHHNSQIDNKLWISQESIKKCQKKHEIDNRSGKILREFYLVPCDEVE